MSDGWVTWNVGLFYYCKHSVALNNKSKTHLVNYIDADTSRYWHCAMYFDLQKCVNIHGSRDGNLYSHVFQACKIKWKWPENHQGSFTLYINWMLSIFRGIFYQNNTTRVIDDCLNNVEGTLWISQFLPMSHWFSLFNITLIADFTMDNMQIYCQGIYLIDMLNNIKEKIACK